MKHWKGAASALVVAVTLVALTGLVTGCAEPPVASFTTDKTNVVSDEPIRFTNESTGEITSWFWDFGDGSTSTEEDPSHAYAEAGHYTISLTVSNRAGSDTDTLAITVLGPPSARCSASETKTKPGVRTPVVPERAPYPERERYYSPDRLCPDQKKDAGWSARPR